MKLSSSMSTATSGAKGLQPDLKLWIAISVILLALVSLSGFKSSSGAAQVTPEAFKKPTITVKRVSQVASVPTQSLSLIIPGNTPSQATAKTLNNPALDAFDRHVETALRLLWNPPASEDVPDKQGRVTLGFVFAKDGSVIGNPEGESSKHDELNRSVILCAALFINAGQPLPAGYLGEEYEVIAEFRVR
jgi:hypothetical protein